MDAFYTVVWTLNTARLMSVFISLKNSDLSAEQCYISCAVGSLNLRIFAAFLTRS
jgi:hypothetical protein